MRSELEQWLGRSSADGREPCRCAARHCPVCLLFGPHKRPNHDLGPSRITVRDAHKQAGGDIERKSATAIDRKTGTALRGALRTEERVVAGSEFSLRIGIQVWDSDRQFGYENFARQRFTGSEALIEVVKDGLRALQQTGIGSGTSKGSGEIEFRDLKLDGQPFAL